MRILLSNDDGVYAPGLKALYLALSQIADVVTMAPDRNRSGASSSLTLEEPLRVQALENGFLSVRGTPTDCVHLAVNGLLEDEPDMVVAGINAGANLGDDTIYSGTVAAAIEGRFLGRPAIAISSVSRAPKYYDTAAKVAVSLVEQLLANPLPSDQLLNVNVPDMPYEQLRGVKVTRLGQRHRSEPVVRALDPGAREVFWIGPAGKGQDAGEGTDFHAVEQGYVSVTPLQIDLTAHHQREALQHWVSAIRL
ncbi:5'/3'-nucleotidase SurE [Corallincola luteus]|uniref:5'-nucleotidase SurE n=4 Tax=Psychromonadaceae TaxID=267894 RepID=A0A368NQB0_9GAMM|nr:5'/3'-nucleotidase SurE [Corallincola holothuriorum]TAA47364.1 5'/3'-nucleotidase SurE [Corallincola spongiicola]TCI05025.1 5'/3'-nucleotidase SurE [Corallincola luteus]